MGPQLRRSPGQQEGGLAGLVAFGDDDRHGRSLETAGIDTYGAGRSAQDAP